LQSGIPGDLEKPIRRGTIAEFFENVVTTGDVEIGPRRGPFQKRMRFVKKAGEKYAGFHGRINEL
jgi:hypothetical protein